MDIVKFSVMEYSNLYYVEKYDLCILGFLGSLNIAGVFSLIQEKKRPEILVKWGG